MGGGGSGDDEVELGRLGADGGGTYGQGAWAAAELSLGDSERVVARLHELATVR